MTGSCGAERAHAGGARVARLQRMAPFDVGLLKGEVSPGNQDRGAVHRSPPGTSPRVVVTLDALA
ncbi:DUF1826 domain-containing protein [Sorangium cellulosum]|uniref:DUF1826 domain-containing protein n=1 Tax=Sorangium cellulosum TaxID=56 RepID=UPI003D9A5DA8